MKKVAASWLNGETWLGLFLLGLALWLTITGFNLVLETIGALFLGYLLGLVLRPPVNLLERRFRVPRVLSGTVTLLLFFAVPIIFVTMLFPFVGAVIDGLVEGAFELLALVDTGTDQSLVTTIENVIDTASEAAGEFVGEVAGLLSETLSWVGDFLLMLGIATVLATSMAVEPDLEKNVLRLWLPPARFERVAATVGRISHRLSQWAVSQLSTMVFFAVAFGLGLALLRVPFAAQIAMFGGFWEIIPGLGSVLALLLALLSAFTTGKYWLLGAVLVLYLVVVILKQSFLSPLVFDRRLRIHPVLMVLGIALGIRLFSYWGAFFAVPLLIVLTVVGQEFHAIYATWNVESPDGREEAEGTSSLST
jgi:predicted PurR-regulated permease PerM